MTDISNGPTCARVELVVITPLLALIEDQVKKLSPPGFTATFVGPEQEPAVLKDIEQGKFTFVYLSPESTLSTERWRSMLQSEIYHENLISIAVDEVHCVGAPHPATKIGLQFRAWYSRLNELKSLVGVPFVALTATATQKTKEKIFDLLELTEPKEITESPNKPNVRDTVQRI